MPTCVHAEFLRLTRDDGRLAPELRIFLSRSYNLKSIADCETGPISVTPERASAALETGRRFVARIGEMLA